MVICDHFERVLWSNSWMNHHFIYRFEFSTLFHVFWYVYVGYDITASCFNLKRPKNFIFAIIREIKLFFEIFLLGQVDFCMLNLMVKTKFQNYYVFHDKICLENLRYFRRKFEISPPTLGPLTSKFVFRRYFSFSFEWLQNFSKIRKV